MDCQLLQAAHFRLRFAMPDVTFPHLPKYRDNSLPLRPFLRCISGEATTLLRKLRLAIALHTNRRVASRSMESSERRR